MPLYNLITVRRTTGQFSKGQSKQSRQTKRHFGLKSFIYLALSSINETAEVTGEYGAMTAIILKYTIKAHEGIASYMVRKTESQNRFLWKYINYMVDFNLYFIKNTLYF